jgi:hypothetical protein
MKKLLFSIIFISIVTIGNALAFDNEDTHKRLTEKAITSSHIDDYLIDKLNYESGTETTVKGFKIKEWLREGSYLEDEPGCRASNHFHNPLNTLSWTESGMSDQPWFVNFWCSGGDYPSQNIKSNVHWATDYIESAPNGTKEETGNLWDWGHAREHYYIYLTGKDYNGNMVAGTQNERDEYFVKSLQALGQVLHLIQDMAVPAHVRNDFKSHLDWAGITLETVFSPSKWFLERFEYFVEHNIKELIGGSEGGDLTDKTLTKFWDTNNYTGNNPSISLEAQSIGLAEYTNINFASKNTIFAEEFLEDDDSSNDVHYNPYPRKSSTNVQEYIDGNMLPKTVISEDGAPDTSFWIEKTEDGEILTYFLKPTYFTKPMIMVGGYDPEVFNRRFKIDDECARNYAEKLIPRAVGYSAALLDYFFRGELEVSVLPLFSENASHGLRVKIKNVTPTQETMIKGAEDQLALVCRYTPDGANADGSEDKFITAASYSCREGNCDEIQYEEEVTVDFYLPWEEENRIGMQTYESAQDSVKCMLVFKGTLGDEETAVIGKYFSLGQDQIKFNEEWDNGPTGNHTWEHTTADQNPDNGTTSNEIATTDTSSNSLIKDNVRYAGYAEARFNETSVDFNDVITPYTYLQFKIGDLSKTETSTFHWQALVLHFNEGRFLQMTQSGQGYAINGTTATYTFNLGADTNQNIFEMFQNSGVSIPDPFYIERIDFVQQLFQESQPTTTEDHQHMEVDYIRIIEEKHEE